MLISFSVGNYRSFKETQTLNFNAASITDHSTSNVIEAPETHYSNRCWSTGITQVEKRIFFKPWCI